MQEFPFFIFWAFSGNCKGEESQVVLWEVNRATQSERWLHPDVSFIMSNHKADAHIKRLRVQISLGYIDKKLTGQSHKGLE